MQVYGSDINMMTWCVVFALVVAELFKSRVPRDMEPAIVYLVTGIKISHFHALTPLHFHRAMCNTRRCCVVTVYWCGGLGMPQFL